MLNDDSSTASTLYHSSIYCNMCDFKADTKSELEAHLKSHEHIQMKEKVNAIVENTESQKICPTDSQRSSSSELPLIGCCSCSFQTSLISVLEEHRNGHLKLNNLLSDIKEDVKSVDFQNETDSVDKKTSPCYPFPIMMRPLVCVVCDYKAKDQNDLDQHNSTIHYYRNLQTESEFPCLFCNYEGRTKTELKTHYYKIHSKDKLFKCHLCQFRTGFQDQLSSHIRSIHTGEKPFECKVCEFRSASKQGLYYHWKQSGHKIKHAFRQFLHQGDPRHNIL